MSNGLEAKSDPGATTFYEIRVKGQLGPQWSDWFEGLAITAQDNGDTLLTGPVIDQAALNGLLRQVRDLGLLLLSVQYVVQDASDAPDATHPHASEEE